MISIPLADLTIFVSLLVTLWAYVIVSRFEGSYINVLVPSLIVGIPAYYVLPLFYSRLFGNDATVYAYVYVYAAVAIESLAFAYGYTRTQRKPVKLPLLSGYENFTALSLAFLALGLLTFLPVLLEFRADILNPREIYKQTRTGFGSQFFLSTTFLYVAIMLILFSKRSWMAKTAIILAATGLISLHGSKAQILGVLLILALYFVYVAGKKFKLAQALILWSSISLVVLVLFAATMSLEGGAEDAVESVSQYADYTRNATLVIDSHFPVQYGRLTMEANVLGVIPRAIMPNKPKNFGPFYLADHFFPESFDADFGSPAFGVGVQYADFGALAIVYIAAIALFRGWLTRIFVDRLLLTEHPADFFMVVFLAEVPLFPTGVGWPLPEAVVVALLLRYLSCFGASRLYRERSVPSSRIGFGGTSIGPRAQPVS